MSDIIAAVATGMQVSAIGIVRLSGSGCIELIDRLFFPLSGKKMSQSEDRKLVFGRLCDRNGETLDVCLCTISRAPHSYTGEDTAELQCHGSPTVLRAALDELFALGARQAGPGEFTKRAFLNGRMELCAAEAVADIIDAESVECAKNAAGQLSGALSRRIDGVYAALTDISGHYHAVLDYPDEDIEDFRLASYADTLGAALKELETLLHSFERGKLMTGGIPAAIIGRPNAGKSSLLNALLGYDRAIVTDVPGTTRDTVEEKLKIGRLTLRLIDTAGIRETEDEVERIGVQRSMDAVKAAALVLVVVDGSAELAEADRELIKMAERAPKAVAVMSKNDIAQHAEAPATSLPVISLSSVTGEGIADLEGTIEELFPLPDVPAGEILTNSRQADAVGRAAEYMRSAIAAMNNGATPDIVLTETEGAMSALGELSGRTVREDVTNNIFSRFCVGK